MAFQVKVEYGGKRFATFLLENVSYDGLVSSIRKHCSSLAHLDADKIRLCHLDEDGDMVNVCQADLFAFSEMLRTAKESSSRERVKHQTFSKRTGARQDIILCSDAASIKGAELAKIWYRETNATGS
ncbi:unnamed protein product [Porites evermanni]|uniref:PB1 domain-containing protein n=1 Tax=Porites evermanni TaxID=104178 RepID=A0ABN8SU18_9CNID|nr:unnamed protein product [Porites evermanni]